MTPACLPGHSVAGKISKKNDPCPSVSSARDPGTSTAGLHLPGLAGLQTGQAHQFIGRQQ